MTETSQSISSSNSPYINPYFLAPSDHSGMALTNILFTGTNFVGWSKQIRRALGSRYKMGFLLGTTPMPADTESEEYHKWMRRDYMVTMWVLNSMTKESASIFLHAETSLELW